MRKLRHRYKKSTDAVGGKSPLTREFALTTTDVTRVLVANYFIGVGFGLFHGPSVIPLFNAFGLVDSAQFLSAGLFIGLSSLIFLDVLRRTAVLLLAGTIFLSGYVSLVSPMDAQDVGLFWRDMGLICFLFITLRDKPSSDHISEARATVPTSATQNAESSDGDIAPPRHPRRVRTEIYRQDFDIVRVP